MSQDKQTTFEPFIEKENGYTQMGIRIKNPPQWMIEKAKADEMMREANRDRMAKMLYGEGVV